MIHDACQQSADAEYLSARACSDDNPELLRLAAQLRAGARQRERDAWAMAALETQARKASGRGPKPLWQLIRDEPAPPTKPVETTHPTPIESEATGE
jgi:putative protein kinase ArgK-like GTPase of G3E family